MTSTPSLVPTPETEDEMTPFDKSVKTLERLLRKSPNVSSSDLMLNFVMPLLNDLRHEFWMEAGLIEERLEVVEDATADEPDGAQEVLDGALQVINLMGALIDAAFMRAGWRATPGGPFSEMVPPDLKDAVLDVQQKIMAWVGTYNALAESLAEEEDGDDDEEDEDDETPDEETVEGGVVPTAAAAGGTNDNA